ncbi:hypothetical protein CR513_05004, partial [Mucuna pruriens]
MKAFPFSLDGVAKDLLYLQSRPEQRPQGRRFVGSGNTPTRRCMNREVQQALCHMSTSPDQ